MKPLALLPALCLLAGCSFMKQIGFAPNEADPAELRTETPFAEEPAHVVIQHVLVSFDTTDVPGVMRTKDEAKRLAERVLDEARRGKPFADLVRLYSDDRTKDGMYNLANWGVPAGTDETERKSLVRGFTAIAFTLPVGGVGLVAYDANTSPFGWHVVKRLK